MHNKLVTFIEQQIPTINAALTHHLTSTKVPLQLKEAMAYSVNAGGKRIRPLLLLATLEDLGVDHPDALHVAAAVEYIHTYSLIHDDLPCMDDDDYRRGQLTNHKVYGEAVAVLAGDALQTLAFETLTKMSATPPAVIVQLIELLSKAAGQNGMVAGQVLDMEGEQQQLSLQQLEEVHLKKTGALLSFCIEAGAILAQVDEMKKEQLVMFAQHIGLAFQIKDDILDITSTTETLGKTAGSDVLSDKSTYPSLLGIEGAQRRLEQQHELAVDALSFLNLDSSLLSMLADYIMNRNV